MALRHSTKLISNKIYYCTTSNVINYYTYKLGLKASAQTAATSAALSRTWLLVFSFIFIVRRGNYFIAREEEFIDCGFLILYSGRVDWQLGEARLSKQFAGPSYRGIVIVTA